MDQQRSVALSLSIASISEIELGRTSYTKTIRIPMTRHNRNVLGDSFEVHSPELFNHSAHTARVEVQGHTIIEGTPLMTCYETDRQGIVWYCLNILGAGKAWIDRLSERKLREAEIHFDTTLHAHTVQQSWEWNRPVRFFPVQRDRLSPTHSSFEGSVRLLTFQDYHPFLHVQSVLEQIFTESGYRMESQFLGSAFFNQLYMSGKYPSREVDTAMERMGFLAKRIDPATASADRFGRVYADPLTPLYSIGNVVDTALPEDLTGLPNGPEVFTRNGCFRKQGKRIGFFPMEPITVGFEYDIRYQTDYILHSRHELKCFNRIYLEDNYERRYQVRNPYEDRRENFQGGWEYRVVVFDHVVGEQYKLTYDMITNPEADREHLTPADYTRIDHTVFCERTTLVQIPEGNNRIDPRLWIRQDGGAYSAYTGDWALYDGYVNERGETTVEVTVRSSTSAVSPSRPKYFDNIHFGGAEPGMKLTLSAETSLRPIFSGEPCEGERVGFSAVAAYDFRQIELVKALKQMFHLYFYTDDLSKTIYIEPRNQFFDPGVVVDWSEKIDLSRPIQVEELGNDMPETLTLRYRDEDGSVNRQDSAQKEVLGLWSTKSPCRFSRIRHKTYGNPLFSPSLHPRGNYPDAPEASILQVGDRSRQGTAPSKETLNFPPKIVGYLGMTHLNQGNRWGWPSFGTQYPRLCFQEAQPPFNLCFEDRGGVSGLHSFYDKTIRMFHEGKKIKLFLRLTPSDIEPFVVPNDLKHDFRALYRLRIQGEEVLCQLEEIIDYDPQQSSTQCIFLKHI